METTFLLEAESVDRTSFDFGVCTFWNDGRTAAQIRESGIPVTVLGVDPSIRNPRATAALAQYLRRERPDILHASIGEANFHAALVGRLCGVPVTIIEEQGLPDRGPVGRGVHALLYRRVEGIVGVSQASCAYLTDREWAPRSRVHLLYNAAASRYFYTPAAPRPARDAFEFLAVGRLVEVKNHARLLRAFRLVADRLPEARLRIVGEGPLRPALEALVAELGLGERVALPGFSADVLRLLDEGDAFVLPSLSEGFGIAAVEAMARGLPPIVSDTGALGEVTAGLGERWTVPATDVAGWAEAMIRMATLPADEMAALRATAREVAERFSQARHIEALQSLYLGLYRDASRRSV